MQGPLAKNSARISAKSSHKDPYKIIQGFLRENLIRIPTRASRKGLYQIMQAPLTENVTKIPQSPRRKKMQRAAPRCLIHLDRVDLFGRIERAVAPVCQKKEALLVVRGGGALGIPPESSGLLLCRRHAESHFFSALFRTFLSFCQPLYTLSRLLATLFIPSPSFSHPLT